MALIRRPNNIPCACPRWSVAGDKQHRTLPEFGCHRLTRASDRVNGIRALLPWRGGGDVADCARVVRGWCRQRKLLQGLRGHRAYFNMLPNSRLNIVSSCPVSESPGGPAVDEPGGRPRNGWSWSNTRLLCRACCYGVNASFLQRSARCSGKAPGTDLRPINWNFDYRSAGATSLRSTLEIAAICPACQLLDTRR